MNKTTNKLSIIVLIVFTLFIVMPDSFSWTKTKKSQGSLKKGQNISSNQDQLISIDFNNVDIAVFIKFISELTGTNFVIDPRVKGTVTILSPSKISLSEAFRVFESVLEIHGYTTIKAGEVTKIVPSPDARTKNIKTLLKEGSLTPKDEIVTQLVPLQYASAEEIKRLFTPFISKSGVMLAYRDTNTLIITDVHSNITRLIKILSEIDVMGIGQKLSVIPVQFADADKMVKILNSVFNKKKKRRDPKDKGISQPESMFVADERTNIIIVHASEVETIRIKKLISLLDKKTPKGSENIRVYYLENAMAEELAKVLQNLSSKKTSVKGKRRSLVVSENVKITADKSTNSLIIMAEKDDYQVLEKIISKLDIQRSMVYIESLLMEVRTDKDFQIGTEWMAMRSTKIDNNETGIGGGFDGGSNFANTGSLSAGLLPSGFSLGIFTELLEIGGVKFPSLAAVARAYKKDKDVNILSMPQLLTTDNQEATITVGRNVPYQTRSAAENASTTYSSYEYKDVGLTLKITPHISKDRMVRLDLSQELTQLTDLAEQSTDRPTTLKRSIATTVVVRDKNTIVIGGLIGNSFSENENKVPCLGDLPGLGWLFKSRSHANEKTNLFVFITPHVVQNAKEAKDIYQEKKENIESLMEKSIIEGNVKMYPANKNKSKGIR